jgi:hypothetical protein
MKMDIEGAELDALHGAGAALQKVGVVLFEILDKNSAASEYLKSMGFDVSKLDGLNMIAVNRNSRFCSDSLTHRATQSVR